MGNDLWSALRSNPRVLEIDLHRVTYLGSGGGRAFLSTLRAARPHGTRVIVTHTSAQAFGTGVTSEEVLDACGSAPASPGTGTPVPVHESDKRGDRLRGRTGVESVRPTCRPRSIEGSFGVRADDGVHPPAERQLPRDADHVPLGRTARGPIAVTGFLLVPRGAAPRGGWPVISWGHGATGVGPVCAPSRHANLYPSSDQYAETDMIEHLVQDGYAVVGTDYPGLGFPDTVENFPQTDLESRSVIDAVLAARQAPTQLGRQWFAVGHSQGGTPVLRVGEDAARWAPGLRFLGTVALAPPSHFAAVMDETGAARPPVNVGLAVLGSYIAVGAHLYSPRIQYTNVLAPRLAAQIPLAKKLCADELDIYLNNVQLQRIGNPHWARNATLRRFIDSLEPAKGRSAGPILLLQGERDQTVPVEVTTALNKELCDLGDVVNYRIYADANHESVLSASYKDVAAWLRDRLQGQPAPSTCQSRAAH
ncbi:alpha/beta fold hydrolase [Streptomyces sp. NPDC020794]|uniref:alpha/beta fold hydrolase n=1 Tax=Streptomyces sp. NPDC020794 TaxID=3365090 RepID=UPI0037938805